MLFFPLINVKMPTVVGILTFMGRKVVFGIHHHHHGVSRAEFSLTEPIPLQAALRQMREVSDF